MSPVVGAYCIRPTDGPAGPNDGRVMGGFVERWLGIRTCFRHQWVAFVGRMQYAPTRVTCHTSKYGRAFRTGYTLSIEIRTCFPYRVHITHRNTEMFFEPDMRYPSKYGRVFRTGCMFRLGIRPCFPKGIHVIYQNTTVFSEGDTRDPLKYGRVFRIRRRRRRARGWRGG